MQQAASRSSKAEMSVSEAESWARLRLVQGESSAEKWELVGSLGHTTLTVGSGPDCTWVVREEGVHPIHFSLHWDGSTLRVADVHNAGDVQVDGTPLTSQWRPLLGRMRIEFGKAALVVESSAGAQTRSSEHPLEPARSATLSEVPAEVVDVRGSAREQKQNKDADSKAPNSAPAQNGSTRAGKETLLGVAPLPQEVVALLQAQTSGPTPSKAASGPVPVTAPAPASSARSLSMKATLVGGVGMDLKGAGAPATDPDGKPSVKPNATLMGFNVVNVAELLQGALNGQAPIKVGDAKRAGSTVPAGAGEVQTPALSASAAPRTSSESPGVSTGRRSTREGTPTPPPGGPIGGVAQMPFRRISSSPPASAGSERGLPNERVAGAWQEGGGAFGGRTLRGVSQPEDEAPPRPQFGGGGHSHWELGDRFSDVPTQMRDPASFEARRPNREFPWRYVGVLALTTVAYFAWLYLLDHM